MAKLRIGKFKTRKTCRFCKSLNVEKIIDLGFTPLAGAYRKEAASYADEFFYPLRLFLCKGCGLVQIMDIIPKTIFFKDYRYLSSVTLEKHFNLYAKEMMQYLKKKAFAVEIGSNDGVLLKPLQAMGVTVLGVDPAKNITAVAKKNGINTITNFFTPSLAKSIVTNYGKADIIFANNVLAHIDNMKKVFDGIALLLKQEGILVFEVHYFPSLLKTLQYDFIYHEHLSYYLLTPLKSFLKKFHMEMFKVKMIQNHAGSIRVYAKFIRNNKYKVSSQISNILKSEKNLIHDSKIYKRFNKRILMQRNTLKNILDAIKMQRKKIIGYGASGRANTLLNFCSIDNSILECIIDSSPERIGRVTPGTHISIVSPDILKKEKPDYILLLAWNLKKTIMEKEKNYTKSGGRWILPLPIAEIK